MDADDEFPLGHVLFGETASGGVQEHRVGTEVWSSMEKPRFVSAQHLDENQTHRRG